jgi:hypothetical protein
MNGTDWLWFTIVVLVAVAGQGIAYGYNRWFWKRHSAVNGQRLNKTPRPAIAPPLDRRWHPTDPRWVRESWPSVPERFRASMGEPPEIWNLDGVAWADAHIPRKRHSCTAQTYGISGLTRVSRCACGAIGMDRSGIWLDRNSRVLHAEVSR